MELALKKERMYNIFRIDARRGTKMLDTPPPMHK
jgi:hypothetical protein